MKNATFRFVTCLIILISCQKENNPPSIQQVIAIPRGTTIGETVQLNCTANDFEGDVLTYSWFANAGSFIGSTSGSSVLWKAPEVAGNYNISISVSDNKSVTEYSRLIDVKVPPSEVTGFVYFSGTTIPVSEVIVKIGALQSSTSSDGKFIIKSNMGNQLVQVSKDGFDPYSKNINVTDMSNQIIIELASVTYTSRLYGTVKNEKGLPIPGIPVVLLNPGGEESNLKTTTDASGYYQLPSVPQGVRIILFQQVNPYERNTALVNIGNTDYPYSVVLTDLSPVPDFSTSPINAQPGLFYTFYGMSTNSPTEWSWDFGDGTTSQVQNPVKTFKTKGDFDVLLKVTNNYGVNTISKKIVVVPLQTGTLVFEGRTYKTIIIGGKEWMAENMAYLPAVHPSTDGSYSEPRYYVYNYQGTDVVAAKKSSNYTDYGVLYNWSAAILACPRGWHLPSDEEWTELENYLIANRYNYDGTTTGNKIAKSMAEANYWKISSNSGAIGNNHSLNNKSGFSALPGGCRYENGTFDNFGSNGNWWSSAESGSTNARYRSLYFDGMVVYNGSFYRERGSSVRYVRD